jgi:hypothetical protein
MPQFKNYFFKKKNFEKKKKERRPKKKKEKSLGWHKRTWHKGPGTKDLAQREIVRQRVVICVCQILLCQILLCQILLCQVLCARSFVPGPLCHVDYFYIFFIQCHRSKIIFQKKKISKKKKIRTGDQKKKKRVGVAQKDLAQRTWHKGPGTKDLAQREVVRQRVVICVCQILVPDPFVPGPLCQVLCARCSCATLTISFFIQCHRPKNYFFQNFF